MNDWKYYTPKFECDELNYDLLTFAPWSGHRNFVYDFVGAFEPNSIVELGSHYGCSSFTFAQAVKDFELNTKMYFVDTWQGDDFTKKYLLNNLKELLTKIQPEIIVSFQPAATKALICDLNIKIPVVTMSHGDPEDYFHTYPLEEIPAIEKSTINQVLMPSFEEHIKSHLPNAKTITIGNAIPQFDFSADLAAEKEVYKIIFVGRLTKNHKRPHLLIEAFAKLADKYQNWIVELWGAPDKKAYYLELEHLIKTNNLQSRVYLKGSTDKVPLILKDADIFAFPSAYEGFGMALAEGMSVGLPSVGYKNCPAVNELIKNEKTGILCDDGVDSLAEALEKLLNDKALRVEMGNAAKKDMEQYAPEKIWDRWEILLNSYNR